MTAAKKARNRTTKRKLRRLSKPLEAARFDVPPLTTLELAGRLDRVAKLVSRAVGDVARAHDATPTQLHVVERLARSANGLTAKQLAAALAIRPGSLTGTLDGMEAKGLVQRQAVRGDGRQQRVVLLAGAANLVALLPEVDAAIGASLGQLETNAIEDLNDVMTRTERAIRSQRAVPTPAVLKGEKAENSDSERADEVVAVPVTTVPKGAQAPAPGTTDPSEAPTAPMPKIAPPAPPPPPQVEEPRWQPQERRETSEGSLGRGLFRIASRVISAAEGRRRKKD